MHIINGTAKAAEAINALPDGHAYFAFIFAAETGDIRVNIGADAGTDAGRLVAEGTEARFDRLEGQRVSVIAETGGWESEIEESESESELDIFTGAKYSITPTT